MVRGAATERFGSHTSQATDQATIKPERHDRASRMGRLTRPGIAKAGQKRGPQHVAVADDCGAGRQGPGNAPQLATVQELAVGQMHIRNREIRKIDDLTDASDDNTGRQGQ